MSKRLGLITVANMYYTPSVQRVDIALSTSHWFEHEDVVDTWGGRPHIMYRQPAHDPLRESESNHWMLVRLAERLGFGDYFSRDKSVTFRELLVNDDEVDYEMLKKQRTMKVSTPVTKLTEEFSAPLGRLKLYGEDTPTEGGIMLELLRYVEGRTTDDWGTAGDYPLMFIQKHLKWRIHSQCEYQNWLREIDNESQLGINPKDIAARGIEDGGYVRVHNKRGEMVVRVRLNDGIQPELVNTNQGWWGSDYIRGHRSDLIHTDACGVTGNFTFYDTRVEVEPTPSDVDMSRYMGNQPTGSGATNIRAGGG